jgi:hypothetical protein
LIYAQALLLGTAEGHQIPLIHAVHDDDEHLLNTLDGEWFEILHDFRWETYRQFAADYYNALYDFNQLAAQPAAQSEDNPEGSVALAAEASVPLSWAHEGLRCQS